jgi:hypothetical protein
VKWLILAVVVILAAPTVLKRLQTTEQAPTARRGVVYRVVSRHGLRRAGFGVILVVAALAALAYVLLWGL